MKNKNETTIIIIDDEVEVRQFLKNGLERKGYTVITAEDGSDALNKLKNTTIHVAICDIVMPKMDGIEFLKKVHQENLVVEVIMMTGQSDLSRCLSSIEYGACSYLVKPIRIEDLYEHIERARRNINEKAEMLKAAFQAKTKK